MAYKREMRRLFRTEKSFINRSLKDMQRLIKFFKALPEVEDGLYYVDFSNVISYRTTSIDGSVIFTQMLLAPAFGYYKLRLSIPDELYSIVDGLIIKVGESSKLEDYEALKHSIFKFYRDAKYLSSMIDTSLFISGVHVKREDVTTIIDLAKESYSVLETGQIAMEKFRNFAETLTSKL